MFNASENVVKTCKKVVKDRFVRSLLADHRFYCQEWRHLSDGNINKLLELQKVQTVFSVLSDYIRIKYVQDKLDIYQRDQSTDSIFAYDVASELTAHNDYYEGGREY